MKRFYVPFLIIIENFCHATLTNQDISDALANNTALKTITTSKQKSKQNLSNSEQVLKSYKQDGIHYS